LSFEELVSTRVQGLRVLRSVFFQKISYPQGFKGQGLRVSKVRNSYPQGVQGFSSFEERLFSKNFGLKIGILKATISNTFFRRENSGVNPENIYNMFGVEQINKLATTFLL
jgi:hypothetical protein